MSPSRLLITADLRELRHVGSLRNTPTQKLPVRSARTSARKTRARAWWVMPNSCSRVTAVFGCPGFSNNTCSAATCILSRHVPDDPRKGHARAHGASAHARAHQSKTQNTCTHARCTHARIRQPTHPYAQMHTGQARNKLFARWAHLIRHAAGQAPIQADDVKNKRRAHAHGDRTPSRIAAASARSGRLHAAASLTSNGLLT